ncbi:hypothetical protein DIE15_33320 [Burkholderia sp. Bp9031]|nr:hypothetical protein DIE15_33320 [Burkholderia sp. Bp9031]
MRDSSALVRRTVGRCPRNRYRRRSGIRTTLAHRHYAATVAIRRAHRPTQHAARAWPAIAARRGDG